MSACESRECVCVCARPENPFFDVEYFLFSFVYVYHKEIISSFVELLAENILMHFARALENDQTAHTKPTVPQPKALIKLSHFGFCCIEFFLCIYLFFC